jgi:hypothetical protein
MYHWQSQVGSILGSPVCVFSGEELYPSILLVGPALPVARYHFDFLMPKNCLTDLTFNLLYTVVGTRMRIRIRDLLVLRIRIRDLLSF